MGKGKAKLVVVRAQVSDQWSEHEQTAASVTTGRGHPDNNTRLQGPPPLRLAAARKQERQLLAMGQR